MSKSTKSDVNKIDTSDARRAFLNKYGKLAVLTPIAITALMSPSTSAAPKSCRGNGTKSC